MNHFSRRTDWDISANELTVMRNRLRRERTPVLDLTVSNPSLCGFDYPAEWLTALSAPQNFNYTPDPQGLPQAREAVCEYYRGQGIDIDPQNIFLTASTSEAYSFLFRLLTDPHDRVLFPKPGYPLFEFLCGLNDLQWGTYDLLDQGDQWVLSPDFPGAVTPDIRALILVHPNNPTGSVLDSREQNLIRKTARERQIPLICDEVFLDYPVKTSCPEYRSLAGRDDILTFVLGGLSKTLALPQMKLSWIVVNGPREQVREARQRLEIITDTYLSLNTPVQNALPLWLSQKNVIQDQIRARIRQNVETAGRILEESNMEPCPVSAGWSLMIRLPENAAHEEDVVISLLQEQKVLVHPGYFFDVSTGRYLVVSLLPETEIFAQGCRRIAAGLRQRAG